MMTSWPRNGPQRCQTDDVSDGNSATFNATIEQASGGKATGIVVPSEVIDALGAGQRPPVRVMLGDYRYRTTVGVMGGRHALPVSAEIRQATGLSAGDVVQVTLTVDQTAREVEIPPDLEAAFAANPPAGVFFDQLSNSLQRYHIETITAAKSDDTRRRRIEKALQLFLENKKR
jgi:hypothetical protein